MISLTLFLVVAAVICWIIATFGISTRFNLIAAGLALFGIAYLLGAVGPVS